MGIVTDKTISFLFRLMSNSRLTAIDLEFEGGGGGKMSDSYHSNEGISE